MGNTRLTRFLLQQISRKTWHAVTKRTRTGALDGRLYSSNSMKEVLKPEFPEESSSAVCIYKVPDIMRRVQRKAYEPNVISIGPYHHGVARLQDMEKLKLKFVRRLFDPNGENGVKLDVVKNALGKLEEEAQICYSEEIKLKSDKFVEMMLIDGCFIVELLREVWQHKSGHQLPFIQRWMLPTFRRDLIMLENKLPFFVLSELFQITSKSTPPPPCLQKLALHFFNPLLQRDLDTTTPLKSIAAEGIEARHFLDLFRSSILPRMPAREKQPIMIRSITELKEADVKIQKVKYS